MLIVGLTGSIGMGKSTAAALFRDHGIAVCDADAEVHKLYEGAAVAPIEAAFPGTTDGGKVDRQRLAQALIAKPEGFARLKPSCTRWCSRPSAPSSRRRPPRAPTWRCWKSLCLLETGGDARVDVVVVVSAPADKQRERVMQRPDMTPEKLEQVLARQMPDAEKRACADFVVDTGGTLAERARKSITSSNGSRAGRGQRSHGLG